MAAQAAQAAQVAQANALELFNKIKTAAMDLKAKFIKGEEFISFEEAVSILRTELRYPEDKALHFVKRFDHNQDGRLSMAEFNQFKNKIEETKVRLVPKFKEYDRDGNGYITLDEASYILQNSPFNFPQGKVVNLLRKFDKDGNGKLDIEEFADFYAEAKATVFLLLKSRPPEKALLIKSKNTLKTKQLQKFTNKLTDVICSWNDEMTTRFAQLDRDGNGVLSPDEVVSVIMEMMGYDERKAISLMQMFDQDRDGNLDKTEFMQLWANMFGR